MPKVVDPKIDEGADEIGRFRAVRLSDTGGLTQFGAFVETLWPGCASSKSHWHRSEDEMVYVLEGEVTLIEDGKAVPLNPGEAAAFPADVPVGHHLENRSAVPVRYLVIGTRSDDEIVTYPQTGETQTVRDGEKILRDANGREVRRTLTNGS